MVEEMQLKGISLPMRNEEDKEIDYSGIFEWLEQSRQSKQRKKGKRQNSKKGGGGDDVIMEEEREDENEENEDRN